MENTVRDYLVIDFKDAALVIANNDFRPNGGHKYYQNGLRTEKAKKYEQPDLDKPIGVSQLSNVLHIMCGLPPVPLKRKTNFTRNSELWRMAENSYIHYDNTAPLYFTVITKKGKKVYETVYHTGELFSEKRCHYNGNRNDTTYIDGNIYNGKYNWELFHRRFQGVAEREWKKLIGFFNEILLSDNVVTDYTFLEFVTEFHKHLDDERVKRFRTLENDNIFNRSIKVSSMHNDSYNLGGNHLKIIFGEGVMTQDTNVKSRCPLFTPNGVSYLKQRYKGRIIIPIYDDKIKETMKEVGIIPNILEGGLISIVGFKKSINQDYLEKNYVKMTEQKMTERFNTQIVRG